MTSKIPYRVVKCTSHDDTYMPAELENNSENPHTKGWQSARFSEFPQILVLQFEAAVDVHKIQILSHQSKIASSIEVYVGRNKDRPDFPTATFERLGYLSLDSNERSGFRARELKSVYVNTRGTFLKLVIRKCHINSINLFNQVGIVALNVIGSNGSGHSNGPLDDLAVGMSVDEKTAKLIRDLHTQKAAAIAREDFADAKRLKLQISHHKQLGAQLADLERRKAFAVKNEDFDAALQLKAEIDRIRSSGGNHIGNRITGGGGAGGAVAMDDRSAVARSGATGAASGGGGNGRAAAIPPNGRMASMPLSVMDNDLADYPVLPSSLPSSFVSGGAASGGDINDNNGVPIARRRTAPKANGGNDERKELASPSSSANAAAGSAAELLMGDDRPIRGKASAQQSSVARANGGNDDATLDNHDPPPRRAKPRDRDRNSGKSATSSTSAASLPSSQSSLPPDERPLKPAAGALSPSGSSLHDNDNDDGKDAGRAAAAGGGGGGASRSQPKRLPRGQSHASNNSNNATDERPARKSGINSSDNAIDDDRDHHNHNNNVANVPSGGNSHHGGGSGDNDDNGNNGGNSSAPEPLSSADLKDAEPLFDVFGEHNIMCLYSRAWNLRLLALRKITEDLESRSSIDGDPRALFINSCRVLRRGLNDKNAQVFVAATTLLEATVDLLAQAIKPDEMRAHIEPLVMAIMDKLASATVRDRKLALQTLIFLSFHDRVDPMIVAHDILRINKKDADKPIPIKARGWWLLQCIPRLGFGSDRNGAAAVAAGHSGDRDDKSSGGILSLSTTMKFIKASLSHRDKGVRDLMNKLAALVHLTVGQKKLALHLKDVRAPVMEILQATIAEAQEGKLDLSIPADELPPPRLPPKREEKSSPIVANTSLANRGGPKKVFHDERRAPPNDEPLSLQNQLDRLQDDLVRMHDTTANDQDIISTSGATITASPIISSSSAAVTSPSAAMIASSRAAVVPGNGMNVDGNDAHTGEPEMAAAEDDDPQGFCQFCGLEDPTLNSEKLDWHYWQACPMLTSCRQCEQVVEISSLTEHILRDCEGAGTHKACTRCGEAVPTAVFGDHVARATCLKSKAAEVASRCPLCHYDIPPGDDGWKSHLMTACKDNPRRSNASSAAGNGGAAAKKSS